MGAVVFPNFRSCYVIGAEFIPSTGQLQPNEQQSLLVEFKI